MSEKTPYTGTRVWVASMNSQNNLELSTMHIPLWMGGVVKHQLNCKNWFSYHHKVINNQEYTFTYDSEEIDLKSKVMIAQVINHIFVDLNYLDEFVLDYVKLMLTIHKK
jgi:hypothetical protein